MSCVFLNAVKFTERGKISVIATLSPKSRSIVINVTDTGPGIPLDFLPYLFKPFSREDDSLTRQKEGLGLGLLVAKGLARKIGGDLVCVRSDTNGPKRGSEFELRVPISTGESASRASTPLRPSTPYEQQPETQPVPTSRNRQSSTTQRRNTPKQKGTTPAKSSGSLQPYKASSPLQPSSPSGRNSLPRQAASPARRASVKKALTFDRNLAQ